VKYIIPLVACLFFVYPSTFAQVNDNQVSTNAPVPSAMSAPTTVPPSAISQSRRAMILVTATDRSGSPRTQLTEKDLSVVDNDQTGDVVSVSNASQLPLRVAFLLLAGKTSFSQQQTAAIDLAHKILRPNTDRAFVITSRGDKPWPTARLEWQPDADAMEKAVRTLDKSAGFGDPFAFEASTFDAGTDRHRTISQYGAPGPNVFDVLWTMMKSDPTPARRVVVMFRDPWAHSPGFGGGIRAQQVEDSHVRLIAEAQQLWTSFYIVPLEEPKALPKEQTDIYSPTHSGEGGYNRVYDQNLEKARDRALNGGKDNLERLANETGGRIWWNPRKNYSDAVEGIANALHSQFAVTYAVHASSSAEPKHLLGVKSVNSDVRISSLKAYYSRQAVTPAKAASTPELQPRPTTADQTK